MKNAKKKIIIIISIAIMGMLCLFSPNIVQKEIAKIQRQTALAQVVENEQVEPKKYSVNMLINSLHQEDNLNISGHKVKMTLPEGIRTYIYDALTNNQIIPDENEVFEISKNGIKLKIDEIEDGKTYDIKIENAKTTDEFLATFKSATIQIDAQNGELVSFIKQIVKNINGEDIIENGSKESTAIFMYEDETNKIKIKGNKDLEMYYTLGTLNGLTAEELETAEWNEYDKINGLEVDNNCMIYAKSKYKTGDYSDISEIRVDNIDKIAPTIEITTSEEIAEEETSVQVKISDEESELYGASGIVAYQMTTQEKEPKSWVEIENVKEFENEIGEIQKNGTYYIWAKDKVGNISHKSFVVTNIEVKVVAVILESPVESLIGTEYTTLEAVITALEENNITNESGKVTIQLVNNVYNESISFTDKNITLDLNGYMLNTKTEEPAIHVVSGNVNVVDEKYNFADYIENEERLLELTQKYISKNGDGKIINHVGNGINIEEGATFTIGTNDGIVSITSPTIESAETGIYNNNGVYNFYDGVITAKISTGGTTTVEGATVTTGITDTPRIYDPTTRQAEGEEGKFVTYLAKVSGIEAVIGKTRYTKIEEAIKVANDIKGTPEEQVKIDVVANIIIDETRGGKINEIGVQEDIGCLIIDETKNIVINLNEYSITNTVSDYVIKNYGKLEVIDNNSEKKSESEANSVTTNGKIFSTTSRVIYNAGEFKLTSGTIITSKDASNVYSIYNEESGKVAIAGGTVTCERNNAIYNKGELEVLEGEVTTVYGSQDRGVVICNYGTTKVAGGTITAKGSFGRSIDNFNEGTIEMLGGTIASTHGLINRGTGTILVSGGIINASSTSIDNQNTGTVQIEGGTIASGSILNSSTGSVKILDGTITGIVQNNAAGTIEIQGGTITRDEGVIFNNNAGTIKIIDGTITGTVYNRGRGTLEVQGGTITVLNRDGISNDGAGTVKVTGGTITSNYNGNYGSGNFFGISNNGTGTVKVTGGTITSNNKTTNNNINCNGIYNNSTGTIIIGEKDESVSTESPIITGNSYGVYNPSGSFDFYDGVITGATDKSIYGVVSEIPEDYDIEITPKEIEEVIAEEAILTKNPQEVAQVDEIKFKTLKEAVDYCNENSTIGEKKTITMLKNSVISTASRKAVINEGIEIELNLADYKITTFSSDSAIENNGNLKITSNEDIGKIDSPGGMGITNKETGALEIEKGTIVARTYGLRNSGDFKLTGGVISCLPINNSYVIYNEGEGNVTIEKGTITVADINRTYKEQGICGIMNNSIGTVEMKGGTINAICSGIVNQNTGTIKIINGAVSLGIINQNAGTIEVSGGTITANSGSVYYNSYGINNQGTGTVKVTGGTIGGYYNGIMNKSTGTVKVQDGTITSYYGEGIYNDKTGMIEVTRWNNTKYT